MRHQIQLGSERFGSGNRALQTGIAVQMIIRTVGKRRTERVGDGHRHCAGFLCLFHHFKNVCGFSGLGNADNQHVFIVDLSAVQRNDRAGSKPNRNAEKRFDQIFAVGAGMVGGTAGGNHHIGNVGFTKFFRQILQRFLVVGKTFPQCLRLLENLLLHQCHVSYPL